MITAYERHRDKRISEIRERIRKFEINKTEGMKTFKQSIEKA
jgi:hypothetical protein